MDEDKIKRRWKFLRWELKTRWTALTDDDVNIANGSTEYLAGKLQERYGILREDARKQINEFEQDL